MVAEIRSAACGALEFAPTEIVGVPACVACVAARITMVQLERVAAIVKLDIVTTVSLVRV